MSPVPQEVPLSLCSVIPLFSAMMRATVVFPVPEKRRWHASLDVYKRQVHKGHRRRIIERLYQLSGNVIMFKTNVFQSNHPSPPGRSALCGENLFALSDKSLLYSIPCLYAPGKRFRANFMVQWAFSCACFSQQTSHTPISTTAQSCTSVSYTHRHTGNVVFALRLCLGAILF